jgi:hypothetical protein
MRTRLALWQGLLLAVCLSATGCSTVPGGAATSDQPLSVVSSVAFAPDGRLVRIRATAQSVLADVSSDDGVHFAPAVAVSTPGQRIIARRDDPPALAVDQGGRISAIYYVAEQHASVPYISYAMSDTLQFTRPVALTGPTPGEEYAMVRLAAAPDGATWLFWYRSERHTRGGSLYSVRGDRSESLQAPQQKLFDSLCECCRPAVAFDSRGNPVLFARMMFADGSRDHALLKVDPPVVQPAVIDDWRINACPMQGPALSIDARDRYHVVWFTLGEKRQGLFYAYSDDQGRTFSQPLSVGSAAANARHAAVIALAERVVIAWQESRGDATQLLIMQSADGGQNWFAPQVIATAAGAADYPDVIAQGDRIFVSWNSPAGGYRLFPVAHR